MPLPPSIYRERIKKIAACNNANAYAIESIMRDARGTLDGLSASAFTREVKKALKILEAESRAELEGEARCS